MNKNKDQIILYAINNPTIQFEILFVLFLFFEKKILHINLIMSTPSDVHIYLLVKQKQNTHTKKK